MINKLFSKHRILIQGSEIKLVFPFNLVPKVAAN